MVANIWAINYPYILLFNLKEKLMFFKFYCRYHSAAAMRSAYNTGSVSGTGGVSDCAGLQSIGAAITSAATGDYVF